MPNKLPVIRLNSQKFQKYLAGDETVFKGKDAQSAAIAKGQIQAQQQVAANYAQNKFIEAENKQAPMPPATPPVKRYQFGGVVAGQAFWESQEGKDFIKSVIQESQPKDYVDAAIRNVTPTAPKPASKVISAVGKAVGIAAPTPMVHSIKGPASVAVAPVPPTAPGVTGKPVYAPALAAYQQGAVSLQDRYMRYVNRIKETDELIKKSRYVYSNEGAPLEVERTQEEIDQIIHQQYPNNPAMATYMMAKYRLNTFLANIPKAVLGPATGVMELNPHSIAGALVNTSYNLIMAVGSGAIYLQSQFFLNKDNSADLHQQAYQARLKAQELELNKDPTVTPAQIVSLRGQADQLDALADKIHSAHVTAATNWQLYSTGLKNSWDTMIGVAPYTARPPVPVSSGVRDPRAMEQMKNDPKLHYDEDTHQFYNAQDWNKWQTYVETNQNLESSYHQEALNYYQKAQTATSQLDANMAAVAAVDAQATSIAHRYATAAVDPLQSYTWASEPSKQEGFLRDLAVFELQVGREATMQEIQNIKDHWVNPWTDGIGQAMFDPLWLVPTEVMELAFKPIQMLGEGVVNAAKKSELLNKFFFHEAHTSIANRLGRTVYDTLFRMKGAYTGGTGFLVEDMGKLGDAAMEVDRLMATGDRSAAEAFFHAQQAEVKGLERVTFDDFTKFTNSFKAADGSYLIAPNEWKDVIESGHAEAIAAYKTRARLFLEKSGMTKEAAAAQVEKDAVRYEQYANRAGDAIDYFKGKAEAAYLDPHRSFKGSRLIDDTVFGYYAKQYAEAGKMGAAHTLDTLSYVANVVRGAWVNAVLNWNPSRVIRNLIDSSFRDVVYGGNILDDLDTLLTNTHLTFADDVGFVPVEFGQSLARAGLDFDSAVPFKLLYGQDKPRFGILSYWRAEMDRLGMEEAKAAENISKKMAPQSQRIFKNVWNGLKSVPAAFADYNTAIEFTLRLRMFHREYFNLVRMLEPEFLTKTMADLSPDARRIAQEAWDAAGGNAARMGSYVDSLTLRTQLIDKAHPQWSYSLPADFGKGMDNPEQFVGTVRRNIDAWMEATYKKNGRLPNPDEIDKFIADSRAELESNWQEQMAQNVAHRDNSAQIGPNVSQQPTVADLQGSAPVTQRPVNVPEQNIPKPQVGSLVANRQTKPAQAFKNYQTALGDIAKVDPIKNGNAIAVEMRSDGLHIDIGDKLIQKPVKLADALHDATIRAIFKKDEAFFREWGAQTNRSIEQLKSSFMDFLADPVRMYNEKPDDLVTFIRQMENNPDLYDVIKKTGIGKKKVADYNQIAIVMRKYGYLEALRDMEPSKYFGLLENAEQIAHPRPVEYLMAGDRSSYATGKFTSAILVPEADAANTIRQGLFADGQKFVDSLNPLRDKLREYLRSVFPNPANPNVEGALRNRRWEQYFSMRAREYDVRGELLNPIRKLIEDGDYATAREAIASHMDNLTERYLDKNGFQVFWDDAHTHIIRGTYTDPDGVSRSLGSMELTGLQKKFFEIDTKPYDPLITIDSMGRELSAGKQIKNEFARVFGFRDRTAGTLTGYMKSQAAWGEQFGRTADEFYQGLGFEKVSTGWQLKNVGENLDVLKKGLVYKDPATGKVIFFGTGTNDLATFTRQYSVMLFDDWKNIASKNDVFRRQYFEPLMDMIGVSAEGTPTAEQLSKFADTFVSYIINGKAADAKFVRPFESYKRILSNAYQGILQEQGLLDLPKSLTDQMNRMFMSVKASEAPVNSSERLAELVAKQLGVDMKKDDIVTMLYNQARNKASYVRDPNDINEFVKWAVENKGMTDSQAYAAFTDKANNAQLISEFDALPDMGKLRPQEEIDTLFPYHSKAEFEATIDWDEALKNFKAGMRQSRAQATLDEHVKNAFQLWKPKFFSAYPGDSPEALKNFFKNKALTATTAQERDLMNRNVWQIEQFQNDMMNFHAGRDLMKQKKEWDAFEKGLNDEYAKLTQQLLDPKVQAKPEALKAVQNRMGQIDDTLRPVPGVQRIPVEGEVPIVAPPKVTLRDIYGDILNPRVPDHLIDDGVKTWIRNNAENANMYQRAVDELERLGSYLKSGEGFHRILPSELKTELQAWKVKAVDNKNQLVSLAMNGGKYGGMDMEGAINKVNRVMLDYNYRTRLDNFMRNIFPFWQFPSRSFPFWVEALATHPQIVAGYQKLQNLSRQTRYQRGAITSSGKPLPSLDGYIPVPGTDLWFNPAAPLSFTYVLGAGQSPDDVLYNAQNAQDDVPPMAAVAQEFIQMSPVYGFSPAPWMAYLFKKFTGASDTSLPPWPIIPQLSLMPRWMEADMVDKLNNLFARVGYPHAGQVLNSIYPQVSWHDYLVERQMLEEANQRIQGMSPEDAMAYVNSIAKAISDKGSNEIWQQAYQEYTNGEASRSQSAFFTGFFTKPFTDTDADMLALRNQNNLLKSALNSRFQSALFNIPIDAEEGWNQYLSNQSVPEGWLYRLYTDIGYVRNTAGQVVTDPAERAKLLALKIQQDQNDALYYQKVSELQAQLQSQLKAVGIGSPYEKKAPIYDWYYNSLNNLQHLSSYQTGFGTNKPAQLIESQLTDKWYRMIMNTAPTWDTQNETYDQYQQNLLLWKQHLPQQGQFFMKFFTQQQDVEDIINNLRPDQQLSNGFFDNLIGNTTGDGLQQWQYQKDTIFDAMNTAWNDLYWRPYWDSHKDPSTPTGWKSGSAFELADQDFMAEHPQPPSAQEMFDYMTIKYGSRFTLDEINQWYNYDSHANVYDINQRLLETKDANYQTKQDIYSLLSFAGPGKGRSLIMNSLSADWNQEVDKWLNSGGTLYDKDPNKLGELKDILSNVVAKLQQQGLQQPTRDDLLIFVEAEQQNKQLQQLIQNKLGISQETLNNVLNAFYGATSSASFARQYPQDYNSIVLPYIQMRATWGDQNPTWALVYEWSKSTKYYNKYANYLANKNRSYVPKLQMLGQASPLKPPASLENPSTPLETPPPSGPVYPLGTPGKTTSSQSYEIVGGFKWPAGFKSTVPTSISAQIQKNQAGVTNQQFSSSAMNYLANLSRSHPEWAGFIRSIIP